MGSRHGPLRVRVQTAEAKLVYVVLVMPVVTTVVLVLADLTLGTWAATLSAAPTLLLGVGGAVRTFRDPDVEDVDAPRAPWRTTARPASGFVVGAVLLAQSVSVALAARTEPDGWTLLVVAATSAGLGVAFVRSSLRLRAGEGLAPARPGRP